MKNNKIKRLTYERVGPHTSVFCVKRQNLGEIASQKQKRIFYAFPMASLVAM